MVAGGLVLFGSDDRNANGVGYVYAFEQATGRLRWKHRAGAGAGVMADLLLAGDRIYAVTLQDELLCLDLASGKPVWTYASGWINERMINVTASPALAGTHVLFGSQEGAIHAVDAASGRLAWKRPLGSPVVTPLVTAAHAVYFGTFDQKIHRLGLGANAPHAEVAVGGIPFGPPTFFEDAVVVLVYDAPDEASLKWIEPAALQVRRSRPASGGWTSVRPVVWCGQVLAASAHGRLVAHSPDGSEKWSDVVARSIRGIGADGDVLYLGAQDGTVYAYRPPTSPEI